MAKALICDRCGTTFPTTTQDTTTGRWVAKHVNEEEKTYRLVHAVFLITSDAEKQAERGGKATDICDACYRVLLDLGVTS